MKIQILGDDSFSSQARTYAEYRLFAALSQVVGAGRVDHASLVLHRTRSRRRCDGVTCTVTIEFKDGESARLSACGDHPYAAINRAMERLRQDDWPVRDDSLQASIR